MYSAIFSSLLRFVVLCLLPPLHVLAPILVLIYGCSLGVVRFVGMSLVAVHELDLKLFGSFYSAMVE